MSTTIAVSGKGGVGKSTIAALIIRWLNDHGHRSVLAVDADANVNLNELLGVEAGEAVGNIREEMKKKVGEIPHGMTKQQFLEYKIHRGLVETPNFDLITMGRPEGPGCYCYANNLLRDILKALADNYDYIVIDNEAGMEHLSRRTSQRIEYLLVVSDPTVRGVQAAGRISRLLQEIDNRVGQKWLVINQASSELPATVQTQIAKEGLGLLRILEADELVRRNDADGNPTYGIPESSILYRSIDRMMSSLFTIVEAR
jgi:CO dehydrogenase maturation factor